MTSHAKQLIDRLLKEGKTLSAAESCTGGLIAKLLTDVPGCSGAFVGGFVTYTNELKMQLLGISPELIAEHTEVSAACAMAMAEGAARALGTDFAISATGYAGPGGGTAENPVGTVYIGIRTPGETSFFRICEENKSRREVREYAAILAIDLLLQQI